jgi:large conductance mechanosensitive channel
LKGLLKEFKEFAVRGNVVDLAVGFIVGAAFTKLVQSLVNMIIMPILGMLIGKVDFSQLYLALDLKKYPSMDEATANQVPVLHYGEFMNQLLDFIIVAFVIFLVVRQINRVRKKNEKVVDLKEPVSKECGYCLSIIPMKATRCPQCTSQLEVKVNIQ